jgi:carbamoyltransferase
MKPSATAPTLLGVSALYHDAAAALVRGPEIVAAAQEERFSRRRHDPRLPEHAIDYCIAAAGGPAEIDGVAFYEDPVLALDRVLKGVVETAPASERVWSAAARLQLGEKINVAEALTRKLGPLAADNVFFVDHHLSHAASAFYPSPFEDAAIVVADGMGEWASTSIAHGTPDGIEMLAQVHYPHSLGLLYAAFTYHCGLKVNSGEYKLMGMAPYGEPRHVQRILDDLVDLREDGSFRLNTEYFGFLDSDEATNAKFDAWAGGPRRAPDSPIDVRCMDLAASVQAVIDEAMFRLARAALARSGSRNLCLAGGVALNCVATSRLAARLEGPRAVWIQPASGDAGGALGAALHVAHAAYGQPRHARVGHADAQRGSLLGPEFDDAAIAAALHAAGVVFHEPGRGEAHTQRVAQALADGLIVGRFDGRMEFGPRALGNRSILADARRPDGQSHLNLRVKFRESWRPFAPIVPIERVADYFDTDAPSPYMVRVAAVKPELRREVDWRGFRDGEADMLQVLNQPRSTLPGITHVDYSARLQTVDAETHPGMHRLLGAFEALTGSAVLINTSFNVRGEPIVCTPADAVACFLHTGIDVLAIGGCIAFKNEQGAELRAMEGQARFDPD